ncbi:hypothetical protein U1Q18_002190 [Sarracenia purpurea var. burkii]
MAASTSSLSLCSSPFLHSRPFLISSGGRLGLGQEKRGITMASASRNEAGNDDLNYYSGGGRRRGLVDENLIVLRKRIHEMKMKERNYEPPSHWMEWEKNCYAGYDEFICEAVGGLQSLMMDARPSLVVGAAALVALTVPTSAAIVLFWLAEMAQGVLAGVHLS